MQQNELETIQKEVKKEFQVERLILFSDAVFAIVITLMAIEIKLPHFAEKPSDEEFKYALIHLVPVLFAYAVSFFFVGLIWFRHLKLFGIVVSFDKGLVIRNLLMLFFVGLFPFGASIVASAQSGTVFRIGIYLGIIMSCIFSFFFLTRYILVTKPSLRDEKADIDDLLKEYHKTKPTIIGFPIVFILVIVSFFAIKDPNIKPLSTMWIMLLPLIQLIYKRMNKTNKTLVK